VPASGELLESVAQRHLLLESAGQANGSGYRFHRLLLDYLRQRLRLAIRRGTTPAPTRGSPGTAEHEMWTDAARHAIAAGDIERALEWISRCGMTLVRRGDLLTLLGWQRQFPADGHARPEGQGAAGHCMGHDLGDARRRGPGHARAGRARCPGANSPARGACRRSWWKCQVLRSVILALSDDTIAALRLSEECIKLLSSDPWNTNVLSNVLRFTRWKAGDVDGVYAAPWIPYSPGAGSA